MECALDSAKSEVRVLTEHLVKSQFVAMKPEQAFHVVMDPATMEKMDKFLDKTLFEKKVEEIKKSATRKGLKIDVSMLTDSQIEVAKRYIRRFLKDLKTIPLAKK